MAEGTLPGEAKKLVSPVLMLALRDGCCDSPQASREWDRSYSLEDRSPRSGSELGQYVPQRSKLSEDLQGGDKPVECADQFLSRYSGHRREQLFVGDRGPVVGQSHQGLIVAIRFECESEGIAERVATDRTR